MLISADRMRLFLLVLLTNLGISLQSQNALPSEFEQVKDYEQGLQLFRTGQFEAAALAFDRWATETGNGGKFGLAGDYRSDAAYYRALCSWYLDRPDAESRLRAFIDQYPTHVTAPMARIWLVRNTFRHKQYRETLQELNFVKIPDAWLPDSINQEVRYMAGVCWYQYREYAKALKYFSDLASFESIWKLEAIRYTGVIHYGMSNYAEAISTLGPLSYASHTAETALALARSYYEAGRLDALNEMVSGLPDNLKDSELYLVLAAASMRQEKFRDALQWFDTYQKYRNLNYPALKFQYAYAAYRENRCDLASPIFEQLVSQPDSTSSLSSYYLAYCFLKDKKIEPARLAFMRAASDRAPSSITEDAILEYAKISYQEKYFQDAISQLKSYLKKYPAGRFLNEAQTLIGEVLFYSDNFKESVQYLESSKSTDERSLSAYQRSCYYYGLELLRKKAWKEADVYFRKGFNLNKSGNITDGCRYWYGESQFRQGHYEEAIRQYNELTNQPDGGSAYQAQAWYGKGWAYLSQEKIEEAAQAFGRFLSLTSKAGAPELYQDALLRTADCEFFLKNYRESYQHYQQALQQGDTYQDYAIWQSGRIQYRLEKYADAAAWFKKLIQQYRESDFRDDALDQLAETNLKWLIDYKAASTYSRQLIQEHPQSPFIPAAWNRMGIAAYNSNDKAAAEKFFRKVLTDYCQDTAIAVSALNNMSFIVSADQFAEVMSQYRKSCPEINPALEGIAWEAANEKYESSAWQEALPLLTLYLKEYPGSPRRNEALYARAVSYEKSGQLEKALPDLEELCNSKVVHDNMGNGWRMMGDIYLTQKSWRKAASSYANARSYVLTQSEKLGLGMKEAEALGKSSDFTKAIEVLESLNALPGISMQQRHGIQLLTGHIWLGAKDSSQARAAYSALMQEGLGSLEGAEAGLQLVAMLTASGNTEGAEEIALKLKDDYSAYPDRVIKAYLYMIDAYLIEKDEYQAGALIEYILSQTEDYFPGMKDEALTRQKKLTPVTPPANNIPDTGKKKTK